MSTYLFFILLLNIIFGGIIFRDFNYNNGNYRLDINRRMYLLQLLLLIMNFTTEVIVVYVYK